MKKLISLFFNFLLIIFFLTFSSIFFKRTFFNLKTFPNKKIEYGKVIEIEEYSSKGATLLASVIESKSIGRLPSEAFTRENVGEIGDVVTFRSLNNKTARILSINGLKVDSYYGFFDYFSLIFVLAFLGFTPFVIRKIYDRYFRMNIEKRRYFKNRGY